MQIWLIKITMLKTHLTQLKLIKEKNQINLLVKCV